ncbi:DUF4153 domain-containing protein [Nibribacter ruber]|uniref:DUF4153 domain-containing protein n=1 Tax=Nibribacter ruber TaxID=2698458 RepID=A0A6P1P1G0_9BACT|nr:DUF4153 domain-containing protein [Nibribacter ruber]QHL87172.1 DUF4153 domain-containing protein [Nibribacter ruber]
MALPRLPLKEIALAAYQTFLRFPFTLLSALTGTTVVWLIIERNSRQESILPKLAIVSALGLILFFVLELYSERKGNHPRLRWLLMALGVALLTGYYLFLPPEPAFKEVMRYMLLMIALHLAASFAAFLNRGIENGFWQFNKSLFLRLLTAALYSAVLYLGLVLAILAFDQLFDIEISSKVYSRLWIFMVGVFNTWFFLAGVPNPNDLERVTDYPKGLKLFTQFVLLPLVTLYLVILYAYMGKILVQWEWPRGWVSYLVLGFSTAGIFSLLLIHPVRETEGNRWIRTFAKWFYRALFPLLILLLLAIWRRVRDYGITEKRYIVLALALWLLAVAVYFLWSRQKNIKFIPMTLGAIAFLAAFGPWGAFSVSQRSQTSRLETIMTRHQLLVNGQVQKVKTPVPDSAAAEITSIVEYLGEMHQYASVRSWFGAPLDSLFEDRPQYGLRAPFTTDVLALMGLEYTRMPQGTEAMDANYFSLNANKAEVQLIQGYDYLVSLDDYSFIRDQREEEFKIGQEVLKMVVTEKANEVQFMFRQETARFSLDSLVQVHKGQAKQYGAPRQLPANELFFREEGERVAWALQITSLQAEKKKGKFYLSNLQGRLLLRLKK